MVAVNAVTGGGTTVTIGSTILTGTEKKINRVNRTLWDFHGESFRVHNFGIQICPRDRKRLRISKDSGVRAVFGIGAGRCLLADLQRGWRRVRPPVAAEQTQSFSN